MHPWNLNTKSTGWPGNWTRLLRQTVLVQCAPWFSHLSHQGR